MLVMKSRSLWIVYTCVCLKSYLKYQETETNKRPGDWLFYTYGVIWNSKCNICLHWLNYFQCGQNNPTRIQELNTLIALCKFYSMKENLIIIGNLPFIPSIWQRN